MRIQNVIALSCALLAVPFAASVADVESDTLHNNTYQDYAPEACYGATSCFESFSPTQHVTTVITNVSCSFIVTTGTQIYSAQLATKNYGQNVSVPTTILGGDSNYTSVVINAPVNFFVKQGDTPIFAVTLYSNGKLFNVQCLISGYHS